MRDEMDATEAWLETHLPEARAEYVLWRANAECIRVARRLASEWTAAGRPERHGELLVAANVEAARQAGLAYGGEVVAARERTEAALEAHGISEALAGRCRARIERLQWLEADVRREVLP